MDLIASSTAFAAPDLIMIAIIMLVCGLPYVVVIGLIAARKGKSVPLFRLLCFIPLVNVVASIWLASLTEPPQSLYDLPSLREERHQRSNQAMQRTANRPCA